MDCRCGGNSVQPYEWRAVLAAASVLVLTPQIFLNLLASGHASFEGISLLVGAVPWASPMPFEAPMFLMHAGMAKNWGTGC